MARTRQKAKQRKAKRLEQERKAAERTGPADGGQAAQEISTRKALQEVEQAQQDAAVELSEAQRLEPGAAGEAARSAAAMEAATAAEAVSTDKQAPAAQADATTVKPTRWGRRRAEAAREEAGKVQPRPKRRPERSARDRARPERKESRQRGRVITFFIQVWAELRRVQWPNRSQVTQATAVVIVFCLIAGSYLAVWDYLFNKLVGALL